MCAHVTTLKRLCRGTGLALIAIAARGLYVRYHLMVSHLLDRKGRTVEQLLAAPPNGDTVERELLSVMH